MIYTLKYIDHNGNLKTHQFNADNLDRAVRYAESFCDTYDFKSVGELIWC